MPFQNEMIWLRTAVTCWKASCLLSKSFLAMDRYWPSAPKCSAAWGFARC